MLRFAALAFGAIFALMIVLNAFAGQAPRPDATSQKLDGADESLVLRRPVKDEDDDTEVPMGDQIAIERDDHGQFHVEAEVNGENTEFLVDTGADTIALTLATAKDLGLAVDRDNFQVVGQSASGDARGQLVQLSSVSLAGREVRNVPAVILDGLGENLLGQTVLRELGEVSMRGDTMVIGDN